MGRMSVFSVRRRKTMAVSMPKRIHFNQCSGSPTFTIAISLVAIMFTGDRQRRKTLHAFRFNEARIGALFAYIANECIIGGIWDRRLPGACVHSRQQRISMSTMTYDTDRDWTNARHRRYNRSHIRARNPIEQVFGRWKKRFVITSDKCRLRSDQATKVFAVCMALHNISTMHAWPLIVDDDDNEDNGLYEANDDKHDHDGGVGIEMNNKRFDEDKTNARTLSIDLPAFLLIIE